MATLRPLHVPYSKRKAESVKEEEEEETPASSSAPSLSQLTRRVKAAVAQYHTVLATTQLVRLSTDSQGKRESPEAQLARQSESLLRAKSDLQKAQEDLLAYVKSKPDYGIVRSDLTTFATTRTAHKLGLEEAPNSRRLLGCITLPRQSVDSVDTIASANRALRVSSDQLRTLISALLPTPN